MTLPCIEDNYVEIAINAHTLQRLLQSQQLHIDECVCRAPDSKRALTRLLLASILANPEN